jgi:hypothetical protein
MAELVPETPLRIGDIVMEKRQKLVVKEIKQASDFLIGEL